MSYVAVDKDGSEYVYDYKPNRLEEYFTCTSYSESVELPEGSIEKLIGRKLNWEDSPVELV